MLDSFFSAVTKLGDSGFAGAATALIAAYLFIAGGRRQALALVSALLLASTGIAVAKIIVLECITSFANWNIRSPSGHAAIAASLYGTLAIIVGKRLLGWKRAAVSASAIILIGLIASSRLVLHAHSAPEVIIGLTVGIAACAVAYRLLIRAESVKYDGRIMAVVAGIALLLFYGTHVDAEGWLRILALRLGRHLDRCFF